MKRFFPIAEWLPNYKKKNFSGDLIAGLTVGVMLIPQGMAYAMLADLSPIYGLYASTIPIILYAIFGTSRQLAVGPVAMVSLLIASGVGALAQVGSESFIEMAILLALMVGVLQFLMGVFKMGFLVNFLSHPVLSGFISAAAIYIAISQFKHLLGLKIERGKVYETLYQIYLKVGEINVYTFLVGIGGIIVIVILRKINKRLPFPLIVVVLGLVISYYFQLNNTNFGVSVVGEIPNGLPSFGTPNISLGRIISLLPIAITIALIGFTESIAVGKSLQQKHKDYEIDANQELLALGIANIGGAFFQSFPTTGGFGRSAVNNQSGAKTGLAALISASVVILILLFFTGYFYFLPKAILASIIIVAVYSLIDFKEAKHLWKTDRKDFWMFMITALATLILGVEQGIIVGIIVSIIALLIRVSYPHIAELGMDEASRNFLNVDRFEHINPTDEILIVRLDAQLFFANTRFFQDKLIALENKRKNIKTIILDARGINGMDSSAVHAINEILDDYKSREIRFLMTNVKGPVRDVLRRSKLRKKIGEDNFFLSIQDALIYLETNQSHEHQKILALQTNIDV